MAWLVSTGSSPARYDSAIARTSTHFIGRLSLLVSARVTRALSSDTVRFRIRRKRHPQQPSRAVQP